MKKVTPYTKLQAKRDRASRAVPDVKRLISKWGLETVRYVLAQIIKEQQIRNQIIETRRRVARQLRELRKKLPA